MFVKRTKGGICLHCGDTYTTQEKGKKDILCSTCQAKLQAYEDVLKLIDKCKIFVLDNGEENDGECPECCMPDGNYINEKELKSKIIGGEK